MNSTVFAALLTTLAVVALPQDGAGLRIVGPTAEPPQRVRVTLGGEVLELPIGAALPTRDGRVLHVELLPERHFEAPGSFSFQYPRGWRFLGATGVPTPEDGWWSLGGDGVALYLRRHTGDAEAIRDEYLSNLESTQNAGRVRATIELDGRFLVGGAVTYPSQSIGVGALTSNWEQSVFAWQESEDVAWLLTLQRQFEPAPATELDPLVEQLRRDVEQQLQRQMQGFEKPPGQRSLGHPELDEFQARFRWQRP